MEMACGGFGLRTGTLMVSISLFGLVGCWEKHQNIPKSRDTWPCEILDYSEGEGGRNRKVQIKIENSLH